MKKRIIAIMKKEILHVLRDPVSLSIIILLPVFLLFLFGYAVSSDVKHISTVLLDLDESSDSFHLSQHFFQSGYFDLVYKVSSFEELSQLIDSGKAKCGLVIPNKFSYYLLRGEKAEVQFLIDGSNPTVAQTALFSAQAVVQDFNLQLSVKMASRSGNELKFVPVDLQSRVWYNPSLESLNFNIPGLVGVILQTMSINLTAFAIVKEKERGTIETLIVTPLKPLELMLGKIIPYIILAFGISTLVLAVAVFWFHVPFNGSILLYFLLSFLFLFSCLGIGLLISTIAQNQFQAMQISSFVLLPALILSGFIFPVEAMPQVIQWVSWLLPLTHFLPILRGLILKGVGIAYLFPDVIWLFVFSAFMLLFSSLRFRKRLA
jgi:ABC-2 type transport system permease protein